MESKLCNKLRGLLCPTAIQIILLQGPTTNHTRLRTRSHAFSLMWFIALSANAIRTNFRKELKDTSLKSRLKTRTSHMRNFRLTDILLQVSEEPFWKNKTSTIPLNSHASTSFMVSQRISANGITKSGDLLNI